ncbi:MAG TPA: hypothetical protein VFA52_00380 [Candidatus Paceibacterota bacterium]|nr:hypothetical protein [Candidatus Paceibacterota bacterium]
MKKITSIMFAMVLLAAFASFTLSAHAQVTSTTTSTTTVVTTSGSTTSPGTTGTTGSTGTTVSPPYGPFYGQAVAGETGAVNTVSPGFPTTGLSGLMTTNVTFLALGALMVALSLIYSYRRWGKLI